MRPSNIIITSKRSRKSSIKIEQFWKVWKISNDRLPLSGNCLGWITLSHSLPLSLSLLLFSSLTLLLSQLLSLSFPPSLFLPTRSFNLSLFLPNAIFFILSLSSLFVLTHAPSLFLSPPLFPQTQLDFECFTLEEIVWFGFSSTCLFFSNSSHKGSGKNTL